ncbi:MAG: MATE family efflux transporter [Candidatus Muirbacterium halophilum]|nr:MATE family efflux transporter [Candidatus Muirbacterium halophilum]
MFKFKGNFIDKQAFHWQVLFIAIPTMFSFLSDYTYQVIDAYWVASLGKGIPTAVIISGAIFAFFLAFNEIVGVSTIPIFAKAFGSNDKERTGYVIFQGVFFKLMLGIVSSILFLLFTNNFLFLYTDNAEILANTKAYSNIIFISLMFIMPYATIFTALRTLGHADKTFYISALCTIMNLVLDPVLIFGFGHKAHIDFPLGKLLGNNSADILGFSYRGMGLTGAALATVITQGTCFLLSLIFLYKLTPDLKIFSISNIKKDNKLFKDFILIGLPMGMIAMLWHFEQNFVTLLITDYGVEISDGYSISMRIRGALMMSLFGLGIGSAIVCGKFCAQGKIDEIKAKMPKLSFLTSAMLAIIAIPIYIYSNELSNLFLTSEISIKTSSILLRFFIISEFIYLPSMLIQGAFEGNGKNLPLLIINGIEIGLIELPILYYTVRVLNLGYTAIPIVIMGVTTLHLIVMTTVFKKGLWIQNVRRIKL